MSAGGLLARYRNYALREAVSLMMAKDTAAIRTLRRALETLGSEERLAASLGVSPVDLVRWLTGERAVPDEIFMASLDIVASGGNRRHH
jgi:hypothetical protein